MYALSSRAAKCVKQKLIELKREVDKSAIIVQDFKTLPLTIERTTRQKIRNSVEDLNNTSDSRI